MDIPTTSTNSPAPAPGAATRGSRRLKVAIAAAITTLLLGATGAPAFASGTTPANASAGPRLEAFRSVCNYEIDRRLFVLTIADNWISSARHLTDEQRSSMLASNASVLDHLNTVNRPAVNAATTAEALKAACDAIFTDNRVYAVVIPQLLLTIRVDQLTDAVERLGALSADKAATGHDTTEVDAWLADATTHLASAEASVASVTVDSFNADGDAARAAFEAAKAGIAAAQDDVARAFRALVAM